jgi:hypothetical protein
MPDRKITFWSSHARRSEYPLEVNRVRRARISGNRKTGVRRKLKLSIGEAGPASWSRLTNPGACSGDCDRPFRPKLITDSGIVITP